MDQVHQGLILRGYQYFCNWENTERGYHVTIDLQKSVNPSDFSNFTTWNAIPNCLRKLLLSFSDIKQTNSEIQSFNLRLQLSKGNPAIVRAAILTPDDQHIKPLQEFSDSSSRYHYEWFLLF
jgi:hypothetical protein